MPEFKPAIVIQTREYVDPTFLYGLSLDVPIFVADASGGKIRVNRLNTQVFSKYDVDQDIPKDNKFLKFTNSSILSYVVAKAAKSGYDPIITIEDNCVIPKSFIEFYAKAFNEGPQHYLETNLPFLNTIGLDNCFPRDFPFELRVAPKWEAKPVSEDRRVIAHMGLWRGILDSAASVKKQPDRVAFRNYSAYSNAILPTSFANFAVRKEAAVLLHPLSVNNSKASDLLAGIVAQQLITRANNLMTVGKPTVKRTHTPEDTDTSVAAIASEFTQWINYAMSGVKKATILEMYVDLAERLDVSNLRSPLAIQILKDIPQDMLEWANYLSSTS